jgi:transcription elongation GreA/GreB family factor
LQVPPFYEGVLFLNMADDIKQQKIVMWTKKLFLLEDDLREIMKRRGEAAREGDLRENAAYKQATEDAESWQARIADVKKILSDLGVDVDKLISDHSHGKV